MDSFLAPEEVSLENSRFHKGVIKRLSKRQARKEKALNASIFAAAARDKKISEEDHVQGVFSSKIEALKGEESDEGTHGTGCGESFDILPKKRASQRLKRWRVEELDDDGGNENDGINENGPSLGDNSLRTEGGEADTDIFHSPVLNKYNSAFSPSSPILALLNKIEGSPNVMVISKAWASQNEEDSLEQEGEIAVAAGTIAYASPMHQTTQDSSEDEGFPPFSESKGIQNTPRMKNKGTQTEVDEEEEEEEEEEEKEEEKIYTQNMATQTEEGLGGEQDKSDGESEVEPLIESEEPVSPSDRKTLSEWNNISAGKLAIVTSRQYHNYKQGALIRVHPEQKKATCMESGRVFPFIGGENGFYVFSEEDFKRTGKFLKLSLKDPAYNVSVLMYYFSLSHMTSVSLGTSPSKLSASQSARLDLPISPPPAPPADTPEDLPNSRLWTTAIYSEHALFGVFKKLPNGKVGYSDSVVEGKLRAILVLHDHSKEDAEVFSRKRYGIPTNETGDVNADHPPTITFTEENGNNFAQKKAKELDEAQSPGVFSPGRIRRIFEESVENELPEGEDVFYVLIASSRLVTSGADMATVLSPGSRLYVVVNIGDGESAGRAYLIHKDHANSKFTETLIDQCEKEVVIALSHLKVLNNDSFLVREAWRDDATVWRLYSLHSFVLGHPGVRSSTDISSIRQSKLDLSRKPSSVLTEDMSETSPEDAHPLLIDFCTAVNSNADNELPDMNSLLLRLSGLCDPSGVKPFVPSFIKTLAMLTFFGIQPTFSFRNAYLPILERTLIDTQFRGEDSIDVKKCDSSFQGNFEATLEMLERKSPLFSQYGKKILDRVCPGGQFVEQGEHLLKYSEPDMDSIQLTISMQSTDFSLTQGSQLHGIFGCVDSDSDWASFYRTVCSKWKVYQLEKVLPSTPITFKLNASTLPDKTRQSIRIGGTGQFLSYAPPIDVLLSVDGDVPRDFSWQMEVLHSAMFAAIASTEYLGTDAGRRQQDVFGKATDFDMQALLRSCIFRSMTPVHAPCLSVWLFLLSASLARKGFSFLLTIRSFGGKKEAGGSSDVDSSPFSPYESAKDFLELGMTGPAFKHINIMRDQLQYLASFISSSKDKIAFDISDKTRADKVVSARVGVGISVTSKIENYIILTSPRDNFFNGLSPMTVTRRNNYNKGNYPLDGDTPGFAAGSFDLVSKADMVNIGDPGCELEKMSVYVKTDQTYIGPSFAAGRRDKTILLEGGPRASHAARKLLTLLSHAIRYQPYNTVRAELTYKAHTYDKLLLSLRGYPSHLSNLDFMMVPSRHMLWGILRGFAPLVFSEGVDMMSRFRSQAVRAVTRLTFGDSLGPSLLDRLGNYMISRPEIEKLLIQNASTLRHADGKDPRQHAIDVYRFIFWGEDISLEGGEGGEEEQPFVAPRDLSAIPYFKWLQDAASLLKNSSDLDGEASLKKSEKIIKEAYASVSDEGKNSRGLATRKRLLATKLMKAKEKNTFRTIEKKTEKDGLKRIAKWKAEARKEKRTMEKQRLAEGERRRILLGNRKKKFPVSNQPKPTIWDSESEEDAAITSSAVSSVPAQASDGERSDSGKSSGEEESDSDRGFIRKPRRRLKKRWREFSSDDEEE